MKSRPDILVLMAVLALMLTANIQAQTTNPPYLSQMPTVERVKAEIKGTDAKDTAWRQIAALKSIAAIISDMALGRAVAAGGPLRTTPDENRISRNYGEAYSRITEGGQESIWRSDGYYQDPKFREEVLTKFFSPEFRAAYYQANAWKQQPNQPKSAPPSAAANRPQPNNQLATPTINYRGLYLYPGKTISLWLRFYEDGTGNKGRFYIECTPGAGSPPVEETV